MWRLTENSPQINISHSLIITFTKCQNSLVYRTLATQIKSTVQDTRYSTRASMALVVRQIFKHNLNFTRITAFIPKSILPTGTFQLALPKYLLKSKLQFFDTGLDFQNGRTRPKSANTQFCFSFYTPRIDQQSKFAKIYSEKH